MFWSFPIKNQLPHFSLFKFVSDNTKQIRTASAESYTGFSSTQT